MIPKKEIENKTIEAAKTIRAMKVKYNISAEDLTAMHRAYERLDSEHILLETQKTLSEIKTLKQPFEPLRQHLEWIKSHLSIPFLVKTTREDLAKL